VQRCCGSRTGLWRPGKDDHLRKHTPIIEQQPERASYCVAACIILA
jgi:hypothetical protein